MAISQDSAFELAQAMTKLFLLLKPKKNINNIKPIEFMVLKATSIIGKCKDNDVTPSKICEELGLSKSALTAVLNSLEDNGLIERNLSKDDRRMIFVSLTDKALTMMNEYHQSLQNSFKNLAEYLGEEDTAKFIELLNKSQYFISK